MVQNRHVSRKKSRIHAHQAAWRAVLCVSVTLWLANGVSAAGPWRITQGDVRVKCPMTIGGSFDAKTSTMNGMLTASSAQPSTLDGSIAVDLRTLDTGISLRNEHLREKYLETDRGAGYETAVLSQIALTGVNTATSDGKGSFTGSLTLHGVTRTVTGPVEVRGAAGGVRVRASFPVHLPDYNIAEPRYLGVGVKDVVQVDVTFTTAQ
jgi:polyisoprenoid-binding protein YceI